MCFNPISQSAARRFNVALLIANVSAGLIKYSRLYIACEHIRNSTYLDSSQDLISARQTST